MKKAGLMFFMLVFGVVVGVKTGCQSHVPAGQAGLFGLEVAAR